MNLITKLMMSFLELMEAEGRMFRRNVVEATELFLCRLFGGILVLLSFVTAVYVMYMWLEEMWGEYPALLAVAAVLLIPGLWLLARAGKADPLPGEPAINRAPCEEDKNEKR